jgi:hypothetical protein
MEREREIKGKRMRREEEDEERKTRIDRCSEVEE